VHRAFAAALALVALAGCGGGGKEAGAASPREAFELFTARAAKGDSGATDFVTRELDEDDRESFARAVRADVEPLLRGSRIIFDRRLGDDVAVVAAQGEKHPEPGAYALVLARDGERWFVEPNRLDLVYGASAVNGTAARKPVVDFRVNAQQRPTGRMWLDDQEVRLRVEPPRTFRAGVRLLEQRLYSTVAFAQVGDRRGAIAWTFRAR
jgi:hypothetical protein